MEQKILVHNFSGGARILTSENQLKPYPEAYAECGILACYTKGQSFDNLWTWYHLIN